MLLKFYYYKWIKRYSFKELSMIVGENKHKIDAQNAIYALIFMLITLVGLAFSKYFIIGALFSFLSLYSFKLLDKYYRYYIFTKEQEEKEEDRLRQLEYEERAKEELVKKLYALIAKLAKLEEQYVSCSNRVALYFKHYINNNLSSLTLNDLKEKEYEIYEALERLLIIQLYKECLKWLESIYKLANDNKDYVELDEILNFMSNSQEIIEEHKNNNNISKLEDDLQKLKNNYEILLGIIAKRKANNYKQKKKEEKNYNYKYDNYKGTESTSNNKDDKYIRCLKILNITTYTRDEDVIKKAYRQAMMKNHPDHDGNEEKAKDINEAYEYIKQVL